MLTLARYPGWSDASTAHQSRKVSVLSQVDQLLDMEELLDVAMDIREGSSHSSLRDSLRRSGSTRTIELRTKPRPVHTNLAEPGGNRCRRGSEFAKLTDPLEQMRNMHAFDTLPLDAARTLPVLPSVGRVPSGQETSFGLPIGRRIHRPGAHELHSKDYATRAVYYTRARTAQSRPDASRPRRASTTSSGVAPETASCLRSRP
ncbi:hypothetical protein C8T65DRAFT_742380 [Cerioporus squamosus]|nr:hypothetical protein C8T65DRAFT_742380 [Cerioporus squamosus]